MDKNNLYGFEHPSMQDTTKGRAMRAIRHQERQKHSLKRNNP
jgi:hypothetical protein